MQAETGLHSWAAHPSAGLTQSHPRLAHAPRAQNTSKSFTFTLFFPPSSPTALPSHGPTDLDLIAIVDTDASGAVLLQMDRQGNAHPIAFTSRKMQAAGRNYPTHEQEILAAVHALRTYLDGTKFTVNTDHATLHHFPTQPKLARRQACWMELLQEHGFNFHASALSHPNRAQHEGTGEQKPIVDVIFKLGKSSRHMMISNSPNRLATQIVPHLRVERAAPTYSII